MKAGTRPKSALIVQIALQFELGSRQTINVAWQKPPRRVAFVMKVETNSDTKCTPLG